MKRKFIATFLIVSFIGLSISVSNFAFAANDVPDWIKNNAKWWVEGLITEGEYMRALQYLIDEGILQISTTKIPQIDGVIEDYYDPAPKDDNRAQSFIVRFSGGEWNILEKLPHLQILFQVTKLIS